MDSQVLTTISKLSNKNTRMIYHFKAFYKRMRCSSRRDNTMFAFVLKLLNYIINKFIRFNKFSYQYFFLFEVSYRSILDSMSGEVTALGSK